MRTIVIGAVNSTLSLIKELIRQKIGIDMVFSLDDAVAKDISGYCPLHEYAAQYGIPWKKYTKINDEENVRLMEELKPEYIFAVGFSQLISERILAIPRYGVIGWHPADLPRYRGRAAIVWQMLLGVRDSKVTMFKIDTGMDSGDIIDQEPYTINENDYAEDVLAKVDIALEKLCRRVLADLAQGKCEFRKQDETKATYCLKRIPEDGLIDWNLPGEQILRLIRATSRPYPGAYSYYDGSHKMVFWKADLGKNTKYYGFPGQVAEIRQHELKVVLKDGLLTVREYDNIDAKKILAGHKFGARR